MAKEFETRELKCSEVHIRKCGDGEKEEKRTIEGLIPYNSRSEWMGFYEYIAPSAFNKTLADGADVRALMNHDTTRLLGRVKNGSLRLRSEEDGLHIECDLPDTSYAEDVYKLIRDGYNTGLSFGFYTIRDEWGTEEEAGHEVDCCTLLEVRLLEVSFAVSFPAYEGTNSNARSLIQALSSIKAEDLTEEEKTAINNKMRELMPVAEEPAPATEDTAAAESTAAAEEEERQYDALLAEIRAMKGEN